LNSARTQTLAGRLRDGKSAAAVLAAIRRESEGLGRIRLMEVCGTHTVAIQRAGLPGLLPGSLELISGPGCPVCVTPNRTLDRAIALSRLPEVMLTSFGDMLRVPGSSSSLVRERGAGADVRVVYSPLQALELAARHPDRQVVFLGVGFETTAPAVAAVIQQAFRKVKNFSVLVAHKLIPPALHALCTRPDFEVDGLICPGHVSSIIGSEAYRPLVDRHRIPCVVAGFEPVDILLAILMLLRQIRAGWPEVQSEYRTAVKPEGNPRARELLRQVFAPVDGDWRGLGRIPASGLALRPELHSLDAAERFSVPEEPAREPRGCRCGEVLVGAIRPDQCGLFAKECTPDNPAGACMVSSEGTCGAHFRYRTMEPPR